MSEAKQVFLHIGHYKTGTSAIQHFLSSHADQLRRHGFLYPACSRPRNNRTNHGHLSLSLARDHGFVPPAWYGEEVSSDAAFAELDRTLDAAPEQKVILSSEEFVQLALRDDPDAAVADLRARLAGHRVTVLFYIREPLSLLKSWFNEVNKGPVATRTFPVFFLNMNEKFLAQRHVWKFYARHFGKENLRLVTYKQIGGGHLAEFLSAVGCDMPAPIEVELKNRAQAEDRLELTRLGKARKGSLDDYTISRVPDVASLFRRARRISDDYEEIAMLSDAPQPSRLTAAAVIDHYARLLEPLRAAGSLNQKEADNLRDLALRVEGRDIALARALMQAAQTIRPDGPLINRKLSEYAARLEQAG